MPEIFEGYFKPQYLNKLSDERRAVRYFAQWQANKYITEKPCVICGATKDVHKHHDDYTKPLEVVHYCRKHHYAWHRVFVAIDGF